MMSMQHDLSHIISSKLPKNQANIHDADDDDDIIQIGTIKKRS